MFNHPWLMILSLPFLAPFHSLMKSFPKYNLLRRSLSHMPPSGQIASVDVRPDKQGAKPLQEPLISLYYPHDGCHEIIDSMVKSLALAHGADVVVLDSLELALGEFGAFGKGATFSQNVK
jgi:hypothetical protein